MNSNMNSKDINHNFIAEDNFIRIQEENITSTP